MSSENTTTTTPVEGAVEQPQNMAANLLGAFMQETESVPVKAEDITYEGGTDFSEIFFEPQVGENYQLKLITNPFGPALTHRKNYKALPDPKRKGKTFQYVSSGSAKTCKVLELFFELNNLKKSGDGLAEKKIDDYLTQTNQGCVIVQIVKSPKTEDIGKYKLFVFSTFGPNATIANLINEKLNPTPAKIEAGYAKEDLFNIFESSLLLIECTEAEYDGNKGRDFSKSSITPKKQGAFVTFEDGTVHTFSKADIVDPKTNALSPEALKAFNRLVEILSDPKLSVHNWFAYKTIGDPKNSEDTEKYLKELYEKVDEIVPVIKNAANIAEIANYGVADTSATGNQAKDSATIISGNKAEDILKGSVPEALQGSILNQTNEAAPTAQAATGEQPQETPTNIGGLDIQNVLNS